jgi:CRISPR system Cascade subunit CasD
MQSWGVQSRFRVRDSGREPSKSGVVGLLCAALGRPRQAPLDDLAKLGFGVRVDQEGRLMRDYHTAGKGGFLRANGKIERTKLIISSRYYLADATFLAGLEGDRPLLTRLHEALRRPHWPLYLGRKAFVPGQPVWLADGLQEGDVEEALIKYPWLGADHKQDDLHLRHARLRLVLEDPSGGEFRADQPISFAERQFASRRVSTTYITLPAFRPAGELDKEAAS